VTQPTNRAAVFPAGGDVPFVEAPQVAVTLGDLPTWRATLDFLEQEMGQTPRAGFSIGLGRSVLFGQEMRLEHAARLVAPGQTVRARLLRGGTIPGAERRDLVLFEGRVTEIEMAMDAEAEQLLLHAEDLSGDVLARRIGGQRIRAATGSVERVAGLSLIYNPDGRPNAAAQLYTPQEGTTYRVFAPASAAGAVAWTLDEVVAGLLAEYGLPGSVAVPSRSEVLGLLGPTPVHNLDLEGLTSGDALKALLDIVGGGFIVSAQPGSLGVSRRLELWLPQTAPFTWLSHQAPGELYRPSQTDFRSLAVVAQFTSTARHYMARGDRKIYESTFDLVAGWDDGLASYELERYSPSTSSEFNSVRDVFRKWVLNEAGEYSESPYSRGPALDLSAIFEGDPYVRRHRRLLPCLSYDSLGRGYGVYAEISFDEGTTWERLSISAKVLENECGLYLTEDVLPPRYLRAATRGEVRVRVTASIEADACLEAERDIAGAADLPETTRCLEVPAGYRYRKVTQTSRFHGQVGADEQDDTAKLQALVDAALQADQRNPVPGRVEMPYLALAHRVGQRVCGVRGRRLDLAREQPGYETDPVICRVRFRLTPTPATELELE